MFEDIEKTVHYLTRDPIQNLRIRVTLTRLSVLRTRPPLVIPPQEPLGPPHPGPIITDDGQLQQPQLQSGYYQMGGLPVSGLQQQSATGQGQSDAPAVTSQQQSSYASAQDSLPQQQYRQQPAEHDVVSGPLLASLRSRGKVHDGQLVAAAARPLGEAMEPPSPTSPQLQSHPYPDPRYNLQPLPQPQLSDPGGGQQAQYTSQYSPQAVQYVPQTAAYDHQISQYTAHHGGGAASNHGDAVFPMQSQPYLPPAQYAMAGAGSQPPPVQQYAGFPPPPVVSSPYPPQDIYPLDPQQQAAMQRLDHQGVDPASYPYGPGIEPPAQYGLVPTQLMDAAAMQALLQPLPAASVPVGLTHPGQLPEKFTVTRVFSWQEKVYSKSEVAATQAAHGSHAAGRQLPAMPLGTSRTAAFGSQSNLAASKLLDPSLEGSTLFSYVQSDEFCDQEELGKSITTGLYEQENPLVVKMLHSGKNRQQVLNFRCMYILVDLGDESDTAHRNERVLVCIKAQPDGSFQMRPGFSGPGAVKYKFEDDHGGIYEYSVEDASTTEVPTLERRTAKLERAVVERAEELRRAALQLGFQKPPADPSAVRLALFGEIVSAADFDHDHLYVEYVVRFDPERWELQTVAPQPDPGVLQGVTHVSAVTLYPADPARGHRERFVAHFAHPIELEWISRGPVGASAHHPSLFFQVCHLDRWSRYTCEGYGWALLGNDVPGSTTHYIKTWKPLGTLRDAHQAFFVGGSPELEDLEYLTTPTGFNGKLLNKYGFKTQSSGTIKVRIHTITQKYDPDAALRRGPSPYKPAAGGGFAAAAAAKRNRRELSLAMVVERARMRLKDARGGDILLRPGLVSEAPVVRVHPESARLPEGATATMRVAALGMEPLRYQWYMDDKKMLIATSDSPELILVSIAAIDAGSYYCQVSNKDGSVNSQAAELTVQRVSRASRAMGDEGRSSSVGRGSRSPGAPSSPGAPGHRVPRLARIASTTGGGPGRLSASPSQRSVGSDLVSPPLSPSPSNLGTSYDLEFAPSGGAPQFQLPADPNAPDAVGHTSGLHQATGPVVAALQQQNNSAQQAQHQALVQPNVSMEAQQSGRSGQHPPKQQRQRMRS